MSNLKKENTVKNNKNFIPYGTDLKKNKMVKSNYWRVQRVVTKQGLKKDKMVKSNYWIVRKAIVNQGYGLDILINDKDCGVRRAVLNYLKKNNLTLIEWCNQNNKGIDLRKLAFSPYAEARIAAIESGYVYKKGEIYITPDCKFTPYGTDSEKDNIVKSNYWIDRFGMAKEGYGLDVLINDKNCDVRTAVAEQGYGLDILVNDINWVVRETVAKQGYGLNVLINDEDYDVLKATLNYLRKNNLTLAEWCNQNNKEIDLKKLAYSPYPEARIVAIKSGYVYKENEIYIAPECKFTPYGTNPEKDKMVNSYYPQDRLKMAYQGYGLDVLINDKSWYVREAVAKRGYGLNILVKDENCLVRAAVADQDYDLNILVNDKDWVVREAVANQGYGLNVLINDEDYDVRKAVVYQGYGLDILVNDEHWGIRKAVEYYLTSHNLTLEQWKSNQELSKTNILDQAKNAINDGKIDVKNVADNIKSTKSILNDSIDKTNKNKFHSGGISEKKKEISMEDWL